VPLHVVCAQVFRSGSWMSGAVNGCRQPQMHVPNLQSSGLAQKDPPASPVSPLQQSSVLSWQYIVAHTANCDLTRVSQTTHKTRIVGPREMRKFGKHVKAPPPPAIVRSCFSETVNIQFDGWTLAQSDLVHR
jgi:hypothetical protein